MEKRKKSATRTTSENEAKADRFSSLLICPLFVFENSQEKREWIYILFYVIVFMYAMSISDWLFYVFDHFCNIYSGTRVNWSRGR